MFSFSAILILKLVTLEVLLLLLAYTLNSVSSVITNGPLYSIPDSKGLLPSNVYKIDTLSLLLLNSILSPDLIWLTSLAI